MTKLIKVLGETIDFMQFYVYAFKYKIVSAILEWIWYDVYTQCGFSVIFFFFFKKLLLAINIHNTKSCEKIKMKKIGKYDFANIFIQ